MFYVGLSPGKLLEVGCPESGQPPPCFEEEKMMGTWMWMAIPVASRSLTSYPTPAGKCQWRAIPKAHGNI